MDFSKFVQLFASFEIYYQEKIKDAHKKWVIDSRKMATPVSNKEYQEQITKMIIFLEDKPSAVDKYSFDMRFLLKKQSGSYSFINPIVKEVFLDQYLTDEAIEWFVKENHNDYTGSLFGSLLKLYIKRKLSNTSTKTLKFSNNLVFDYDDIYRNVLRYTKIGGKHINFEFGPLIHLSTASDYFLFTSQENFPVYDLAYKDKDSHIYCIGIRSYRLRKGHNKFTNVELSPTNIDKLYNHFQGFKENLGNLLFCFILFF